MPRPSSPVRRTLPRAWKAPTKLESKDRCWTRNLFRCGPLTVVAVLASNARQTSYQRAPASQLSNGGLPHVAVPPSEAAAGHTGNALSYVASRSSAAAQRALSSIETRALAWDRVAALAGEPRGVDVVVCADVDYAETLHEM